MNLLTCACFLKLQFHLRYTFFIQTCKHPILIPDVSVFNIGKIIPSFSLDVLNVGLIPYPFGIPINSSPSFSWEEIYIYYKRKNVNKLFLSVY